MPPTATPFHNFKLRIISIVYLIGVYLIVTQGNGSLYPLDFRQSLPECRLLIERGHPASFLAYSDWLFRAIMGKCLPYVDSYLLFLFLDRTIKRGFSIRILTRNTCEIGNNLKETDTMSLILKYNESFYDILLKYFTTLSEITNIFKFIATTGFIVVVSFILNYIHGTYILKFQTFDS